VTWPDVSGKQAYGFAEIGHHRQPNAAERCFRESSKAPVSTQGKMAAGGGEVGPQSVDAALRGAGAWRCGLSRPARPVSKVG